MDGFFKPIAESPTLQGIAVVVTLFTLGFYLVKYGWKSLKFIYNFLSGRQRRAFYSISRPAYRRAVKDYVDVRLILSGLSIYSTSMSLRLFQLLMVFIGSVYIGLSIPNEYDIYHSLNSAEKVIYFSIGILAGIAVSSYFVYGILRPVVAYAIYVQSLRRLVIRERRQMKKKSAVA
jgi:hypothetical protein